MFLMCMEQCCRTVATHLCVITYEVHANPCRLISYHSVFLLHFNMDTVMQRLCKALSLNVRACLLYTSSNLWVSSSKAARQPIVIITSIPCHKYMACKVL